MRTVSNRQHCTFSGCTQINGLRNAPRSIRLKALQNKVYIPNQARVCTRHMSEDAWNTLHGVGRRTKFTAKQINEMIQLLTDSIKRNLCDSAGEFFNL